MKKTILDLPKNADYLFQHISAKNDTNGNPNRIYHVYRMADFKYLGWIDQGYAGTNFLEGMTAQNAKVRFLLGINVTGTRAYKTGQEFYNR